MESDKNMVLEGFSDFSIPIITVLGSKNDEDEIEDVGRARGMYDNCCQKGTNGPRRDSSMTNRARRG